MPKKRKSRKDKILADRRRQNPPVRKNITETISLSEVEMIAPEPTRQPAATPLFRPASATSEYAYVLHDLRKTTLLTASIVIIELVLFYILRLG